MATKKETNSKYKRSMDKNIQNKVLQLHKIGQTNMEISEKIGFSNSAVRQFLKRNGLTSNKKEKKKATCNNCGKEFVPKYSGRDKSCSKKCTSALISQSKIKYTQSDIDKVIEYKKRIFTNDDIVRLTGVDINKVKEIVRKNNLHLTPKQAQANAYSKKLEKDSNCMEEMRNSRELKYTIEDLQKHALKNKGNCLSDKYIGFKEKHTFKCHKEHIFEIPWKGKNHTAWCRKCFDENRELKYTIEDLQKHAKERGGLCLSNEYINYTAKYKWKCENGHVFKNKWGDATCQGHWCPRCSVKHSAAEQEILEFVQQWYPDAHSTRKVISPKELDIYIPSLNLAIEYCGLYWHNENSPEPRGRRYHYNKMKECNEKGIRLITIFEDEWINRNKQVKNFLKSVLGITKKRIYARKCEIKEVEKSVAKDFLENNHIQGKTMLKVAYGLFFEEELVGLVTGNTHHRQKSTEYTSFVLNRLVFKDEIQVVGGSSKLIKKLKQYAKENNYNKIISWSDNRWSEGNVYSKCGFEFLQELQPDYSYVKDGAIERVSKQSCKKSNLIKKGGVGDTEKEMAKSLNLNRIWDCGKISWVMEV